MKFSILVFALAAAVSACRSAPYIDDEVRLAEVRAPDAGEEEEVEDPTETNENEIADNDQQTATNEDLDSDAENADDGVENVDNVDNPVDISALPPVTDEDLQKTETETATETVAETSTAAQDSASVPAPNSGPQELPPEYPRPGKDRFLRLTSECPVRAQPRRDSSQMYTLKAGRVLWVEQLNSHWYVVYRKNGAAFMDPNCFNGTPSMVSQISLH